MGSLTLLYSCVCLTLRLHLLPQDCRKLLPCAEQGLVDSQRQDTANADPEGTAPQLPFGPRALLKGGRQGAALMLPTP